MLVANLIELLSDPFQLVVWQPLEADEVRARVAERPDDLVELELERAGIPVLRILEQRDQEERTHGRDRRRPQDPTRRPVKKRARHDPPDEAAQQRQKRPRRPDEIGDAPGGARAPAAWDDPGCLIDARVPLERRTKRWCLVVRQRSRRSGVADVRETGVQS